MSPLKTTSKRLLSFPSAANLPMSRRAEGVEDMTGTKAVLVAHRPDLEPMETYQDGLCSAPKGDRKMLTLLDHLQRGTHLEKGLDLRCRLGPEWVWLLDSRPK
jgi:hypothetical protein